MQIACQRFGCQKAVEVCYWSCKYRKGCKDWRGSIEGEPGAEAIRARLEQASARSGRPFDVATLIIPARTRRSSAPKVMALPVVPSGRSARRIAEGRDIEKPEKPEKVVKAARAGRGRRGAAAKEQEKKEQEKPERPERLEKAGKRRLRVVEGGAKEARTGSSASRTGKREAKAQLRREKTNLEGERIDRMARFTPPTTEEVEAKESATTNGDTAEAVTTAKPASAKKQKGARRAKPVRSGPIYLLLSSNGKYRELSEDELAAEAAHMLKDKSLRLVKAQFLIPQITFRPADE